MSHMHISLIIISKFTVRVSDLEKKETHLSAILKGNFTIELLNQR